MAWIWLSITHQLGYTPKCFANQLSLESKDSQKHELVGRALLEQSSEEWQKIFEAIALKRCDDRTIRFRATCPCTIFPKKQIMFFLYWFYIWHRISPVNITIHSWIKMIFGLHRIYPVIIKKYHRIPNDISMMTIYSGFSHITSYNMIFSGDFP